MKTIITKDDILPFADYVARRDVLRQEIVALKKPRRVEIGPVASFYFENFATMRQQIQEMLYIEKGGDAQLQDELAAYNPLVPQGDELTATLMFEIDDAVRRARLLRQLTHVERAAYIEIDGDKTYARPEEEVDRTADDGKTSSVHFLHFAFSRAQIAAFRTANAAIVLGFTHEHYAHMAVLSEATRQALALDFRV